MRSVQNTETYEYTLQISSKANSDYEGSSAGGGKPTTGSPPVGIVVFTTGMDMNATSTSAGTMYAADPLDAKLNSSDDGHGQLVITYLGPSS